MISIVPSGEFPITCFLGQLVGPCQNLDALRKVLLQLYFGYATDVRVAGIHGDILEVVESAEHGQFADFGDTGEETEADVGVLGFHHAVEPLKPATEDIGERFVGEVIDEGLVVFVDEDDDRTAGLLMGGVNHVAKANPGNIRAVLRAIFPLPLGEGVVQYFQQDIVFVVSLAAQVHAENRILDPVLLQPGDAEAVEKFLFPAEVSFHRGDEQAFAEAAWTAEEVIFACSGELMDKARLVHIDEAVSADACKILYADRIEHDAVVIGLKADMISELMGITANNVYVRTYRLEDRIRRLNNPEYQSLIKEKSILKLFKGGGVNS